MEGPPVLVHRPLPPTMFDHFQDANTGRWSGRYWGEWGLGVGPNKDLEALSGNVCVKVGGVSFVYYHEIFQLYSTIMEAIKDWRVLRLENEAREAGSWCLPSVAK